MSKTFKSVTDNTSELDVRANDCGVFIAFSRAGQIRQASTFAPSDAPALALAILEAAGVEARHHSAYENGTPEAMEHIAQALTDEIGITEAATAEAKEQAELEAEALELLNVVREARGIKPHLTAGEASPEAMNEWLAIARKAREMRKS